MNIIITLPHDLIEEIFIGHKVYEARKAIPSFFDPEKDRVYMVEKGTDNVVGFFTIANFTTVPTTGATLDCLKAKICVSYMYLEKYYRHYEKAVLWRIKNYFRFYVPLSLSVMFDKEKAPQSYFYTDKNWGPPNKSVNALSKNI